MLHVTSYTLHELMKYELAYILSPKFSDEDAKKEHKRILDLLKSLIGKIISDESWGKKRLAYEIKHFQDGYYFLVVFETEPDKIKELDRKLKLEENVIRFLITKHEHEFKKVGFAPRRETEKIVVKEKVKEKVKVAPKKKITPTDLDKKLDEILGEEIVK